MKRLPWSVQRRFVRLYAGLPRRFGVAPIEKPEQRGNAFEARQLRVNDQLVFDVNLTLILAASEVESPGVAAGTISLQRLQGDVFLPPP